MRRTPSHIDPRWMSAQASSTVCLCSGCVGRTAGSGARHLATGIGDVGRTRQRVRGREDDDSVRSPAHHRGSHGMAMGLRPTTSRSDRRRPARPSLRVSPSGNALPLEPPLPTRRPAPGRAEGPRCDRSQGVGSASASAPSSVGRAAVRSMTWLASTMVGRPSRSFQRVSIRMSSVSPVRCRTAT